MSDLLKVAAIQLDITDSDKTANINRTRELFYSLPEDIDIAVVPEMFTTGFICDSNRAAMLAEPTDGITMNEVRRWAHERKTAVCGSFIACDGDAVYNRAFFVEPSGDEYFYDKHHLFSISGEDAVYKRGVSPVPQFRFRGWNISMAVCFDLRFPAWLRNCGKPYDLLIIMANWPDSRVYAWKHLLIARAIENQSYVIGCNRTGSDCYGVYGGTSLIADAKGRITEAEENSPIVIATLSKDALTTFREKFPILSEGDHITL